MKNLLTKNKNKFLTIFLTLALIVTGTIFCLPATKIVEASIRNGVTVTDSNFAYSSSTNYPFAPNSWTKINISSNLKSGIINLDETSFLNKQSDYDLSFNPSTYLSIGDEKLVLMINSSSTTTTSGYESPSFKLSVDSYFIISFWAYTQTTAHGSAKLYDENDNLLTTQDINSNGSWQEYSIFVQTNSINALNCNLQFLLGDTNDTSIGAVFFDNLTINQVSNDIYTTSISNIENATLTKIVDLQTDRKVSKINNADFENDLTSWEQMLENGTVTDNPAKCITGVYYVDDRYDQNLTKLATSPTNANILNNTKSLLINNIQLGSVGYKSNEFVLEQHALYKISFLAKASISSGKAYAKLVEKSPYAESSSYEAKTFTNTISSTSSGDGEYTNGFVRYGFIVQGGAFENTTASLELWLGDAETTAMGYVWFDNIQIEKLTTTEYNSQSSASNMTVANFKPTGTLTIANGMFNDIVIDKITDSYPYSPKSWTNTKTLSNEVFNGIINTENSSAFSSHLSNPGTINGLSVKNNVLVIGNVGKNFQTYKSGTFTLSANSYYEISFAVQTQHLVDAKASVKLLTDTRTLAQIINVESDSVWTTYTFKIATGLNAYTCSINLSLGENAEGYGYALFDNVKLSNSTEAKYTETSANALKVNLKYEDFTNISDTKNGISTPSSLTVQNSSNTPAQFIKAGIIDTVNFDTENLSVITVNPYSPANSSGKVLMIYSTEDINYSYKSVDSFSIASGTYYKISVWVKTNNLAQNEENKTETTTTGTYYPFGASFSLSGMDAKFTGISTDNVWKEYSFYVNSKEAETVNLEIGLGDSNALTRGYVYFSELKVETIDEAAYNTAVAPLEETDAPNNIMAIGETTTDNDDETDTETPTTSTTGDFNWLVIPTLLTCLALLITIVCWLFRKLKIKTKIKLPKLTRKNSIYDRKVTLQYDQDERIKLKARQEKLAELEKELDDLREQIEQNKKSYKNKTNDYEVVIPQISEEQKSTLSAHDIKAYEKNQNLLAKEQRKELYRLKREKLITQFNLVEQEINQIYTQEMAMIEEYKNYKKAVKEKKQQSKNKKRK